MICSFSVFLIGVQVAVAQMKAIPIKLDDKTQKILQDATSDHWLEMCASAFLGGIMAVIAAWVGFRWQTRKEEKGEKEFNLRVLEAICYEVKILQAIYDEGAGKLLKEHKAGEPFFRWLHISQQHFTVFESNAEHIGKIDSELAKRIIAIYELMKLMVENFGVNSRYLANLDQLNSLLRANPNDQNLLRDKQFCWNQLIQQAELLKKVDGQLLVAANDLFAEFEKAKQRDKCS